MTAPLYAKACHFAGPVNHREHSETHLGSILMMGVSIVDAMIKGRIPCSDSSVVMPDGLIQVGIKPITASNPHNLYDTKKSTPAYECHENLYDQSETTSSCLHSVVIQHP